MSKKRKKRKKRSRNVDPFEGFLDEGDDHESELDPETAYDDDPFLEEELELPRGSRDFDVDRWRDDLVERGRQRQRMRQRDLKRGALRTPDVSRRPIDLDLVDFDDDF